MRDAEPVPTRRAAVEEARSRAIADHVASHWVPVSRVWMAVPVGVAAAFAALVIAIEWPLFGAAAALTVVTVVNAAFMVRAAHARVHRIRLTDLYLEDQPVKAADFRMARPTLLPAIVASVLTCLVPFNLGRLRPESDLDTTVEVLALTVFGSVMLVSALYITFGRDAPDGLRCRRHGGSDSNQPGGDAVIHMDKSLAAVARACASARAFAA